MQPEQTWRRHNPHDNDFTSMDVRECALLLQKWGANRRWRVADIYRQNGVITTAQIKLCREALLLLEQQGKVKIDIPWERRIRFGTVTLHEDRWVMFLSS